jgi:uncharacterized protein YukE
MGRDKVTSKDHKKGEDIFNDVSKMIKAILDSLEKHAKGMTDNYEIAQNKAKFPCDDYQNTKAHAALNKLNQHSQNFNAGRENKVWRTADEGDPKNDKLYSDFKTAVTKKIEEVFPVKMFTEYDKIKDIAETKVTDTGFKDLTDLIDDINKIKEKTIDQTAKGSARNSFKGKAQKDFDKWFKETETALKDTFEALLAYINYLYQLKIKMYKNLKKHRDDEDKADEEKKNKAAEEKKITS